MLEFLDNLANDVYNSKPVFNFPYKSFSETLNLVMVSLLRQLVKSEVGMIFYEWCFKTLINNFRILYTPDLHSSLIKEIQAFVRSLFLGGQNDLQSQNPELLSTDEDESAVGASSEGPDDEMRSRSHD